MNADTFPYTNNIEYDLFMRAGRFEAEYFEDMFPQEGSDFYSVFETLDECGILHDKMPDFSQLVFRVKNNDGCVARFYVDKKRIEISPEYVDDDATLLHELIHYYETSLERLNHSLCEMIMADLHMKLSKLIPGLKKRMLDHIEVVSHAELESSGGTHSLLFFLKSLDLDLRCGKPLGTTMGYGRVDEYSADQGAE